MLTMTYPAQQMEAEAKELMVLTYIREYRSENIDPSGNPINPAVRDIGEAFDWNPSTVHKVIGRLWKKGKVRREFGKPRGVSA